MRFNEFIYGTQYALSLLSYQLVELNVVGIPMKQVKKVGLNLNKLKFFNSKKLNLQKKGQEFDHDYSKEVIKVEGYFKNNFELNI